MNIPGFRSKNKYKMAIASLYYLFSVLMVPQGLAYAFFMLSIPFIIFSGIDFFKKKNNKSLLMLIVSCVILVFSIVIAPKGNHEGALSSNSPQNALQGGSSNTEVPIQTTAVVPSPAVSPESSNPASDVSGTLTIHFLDVGQADSILIMQDNFSMLIDGGNNADSEMVTKYIKDQGITKLDYVIGTHPHEDHIGGLDAVIKSFDIGSIMMPKAQSDTKTFEDLLSAIQNKGLKITTPVIGSKYDLGDAEFVILAPNSGTYDETNDYSVVIKLTFGNNSFLFTGDAEAVSENEMLAKGFDLKADVLKVGHHGSVSSTTDRFLEAVSPEYAIISVGADNSYGHPSQETINKLKGAGITIYRTDVAGTIVATSDGKTISFKSGGKESSGNNSTQKPSKTPSTIPKASTAPTTVPNHSGSVVIDEVDLSGELVTIRNTSSSDVDLTGWKLLSVKGGQTYNFPNGCIIKAGSTLTIASGDVVGDLKWNNKNIWNNDGDPAELYNSAGKLVFTK